ncbi:short-chain dehydrogenase [Brachybacterium vulturis]|uniref:Short-chain dehydrogenase n=1 Tax=Brachybacterium vulturis TaxID=2017484 RepID=A0A291GRA6_9MICO|nr:SDR family NAD(P)-dependent oxidoreductase [Brachybacterium vulturis]ATG53013.1 short-chain dehydrogenase [Brachybacterium vulturis]
MTSGLVAIVGAGPGISTAVARRFGAEGFTAVLLSRTRSSLDREVANLQAAGIEAHGLVADAADPRSLSAAFARLEDEHGTPDVLLYNAGANTIGDPTALAVEDLIDDFTVNVAGALTSAQLLVPGMLERGHGTLLFTGGMLAVNPVVSRASAAISKAGLRNLVATLGDELVPQGLRVGTVTIGGVVRAGTFFDPDLIAESFWDLHTGKETGEVQYVEGMEKSGAAAR